MIATRPSLASGLHWVRPEIEACLQRVRTQLENAMESADERAGLLAAVAELRQVLGTISLIQCAGASILAEEMLATTQHLSEDAISDRETACGAVLGATLQLADYLDALSGGAEDCVLVLQALINELRLTRGVAVLTEAELFAAQMRLIGVELPLPGGRDARTAGMTAAKLLPAAQQSMLQWLKDDDIRTAVARLGKVAEHLRQGATVPAAAQLWRVVAGVAEAVLGQGLEDSLEVKRLCGRAVQQIKRTVEIGEDAAAAQFDELAYQLLFHVGRSRARGARVTFLRRAFALDQRLPSSSALEAMARKLRGPNTRLLQKLSDEIRADLAKVKDTIDLVVRAGERAGVDLSQTAAQLHGIANTLGMLGLVTLQRVAQNQSDAVARLRSADGAGAGLWMDVATALLRIENSLDAALFRQLRRSDPELASASQYDEGTPPSADFDEGFGALLRESLVNLSKFKNAADLALRQGSRDGLSSAQTLLGEIRAGLRILDDERAAGLIGELLRYVEQDGFPAGILVQAQAERFADAVACTEFYLEALQSRSPDSARLLDDLAAYIERLEFADGAADTDQAELEPSPLVAPQLLDEVDPEIREVFVEEAGEVLETLRSQLAPWQREPGDVAHLLEVRRAFHTLKGSGRMVGADLIGDYGWACENLLNRCRDGEMKVDSEVLDLIARAVALLPELIHSFREQREPPDTAAELIAAAHELTERAVNDAAAMRSVFHDDARGHLLRVQNWVDQQDADAGAHTVDPEVVRALHTLRGSAAVVGYGAISQLAGSLERGLDFAGLGASEQPVERLKLIADAVLQLGQWLDQQPPAPAEAALPWQSRIIAILGMPSEVAGGEPDDQQLAELFTHEVFDCVQQIEACIEAWRQQPDAAHYAAQAAALFRTVRDAAQAAHSSALESAATAFEARLGHAEFREDRKSRPDAPFFSAVSEAIEGIYQLLDAIRDGRAPDRDDALIGRIQALGGSAIGIEAATPVADEAGADAPFEEVPVGDRDPALTDIFLSEAEELLAVVEGGFDEWQAKPLRDAPDAEVTRALHTLKGSARMAGFESLGEVGHRLESLVEAAAQSRVARDASYFGRLANVVDGLHRAVDQIRRGYEPEVEPLFVELEIQQAESASAADWTVPESDAGFVEAASREYEVRDELIVEIPPFAEHRDDAADIGLPAAPATQPFVPLPAQPAPSAEDDDAELLAIFSAEAAELLEQMEAALAIWRTQPTDAAPLQDLQRILHTLKGGARMAGRYAMGAAVHEMESLVDDMASTYLPTDDLAFDQLHTRFEQLQHMHDRLVRGDESFEDEDDQPIEAPYDWTPPPPPEAAEAEPAAAELPEPVPPIEWNDAPLEPPTETGPEPVVAAGLPDERPPPMRVWDPQLFWRPEDDSGLWQQQRRELARVPVERLDSLLNAASEMSIYRSRLEQRNVETGSQLAEMESTVNRIREQLRQMDIETEAQIAARGLIQTPSESGDDRYSAEFDPLELDRYSRMQELSRALSESVGDLGSLHDSLYQVTQDASSLLQQQGRINTEVQQGLMGTLMVPFSRQVARLQRVVRQTAVEAGRLAEVSFLGVEAELDRNVLERMTAPLEHLLRNAVVHGIEPATVRTGLGKREVGEIVISLQRDGTQLVIEIRDDGQGLDIDAIRDQAIARGLMPPNLELSELQVAQFIFEPGFSTARELTQNAGRGVGMDVVASEVKQLGGTLDLETERGGGTCFAIRLPLTLAVSQALLVTVGTELYAIPLSSIEGIARVPRAQLDQYFGDSDATLSYGGADYPLRYLGDYLGVSRLETDESRTVPTILVRVPEGIGGGERRMGLVVDSMQGNREVVSKAVGPQVSSIVGVTGATILADGAVVLILDAPALVLDRTRRALLAEAQSAAAPRADDRAMIMVVDDSITMRRVAERLLTRHGYRVLTARDGLDAIAQLATESPTAILLDIEMPRADGFEVAAYVRNSERISDVPIIMITSRSGDKHRQRARELGVNRYLIKPYQEDQLLSEIRGVLVS